MPRCRQSHDAASWSSVTHAAMKDVERPAHAPHGAPRNHQRQSEIARQAEAHVDSLRRPDEAVELLSESRAQYGAYPSASYVTGAIPKVKGKAQPQDGSDASVTQKTSAAQELGITADPAPYTQTYYADCPPMTIFSSRAPEGIFAGGSRITQQAAQAALEGRGVLPQTIRLHGTGGALRIPAPGAELSLKMLFTKFVRRLREAGSSPDALLHTLGHDVQPVQDEFDQVVQHDPNQPSTAPGVPAASFRKACYALKLSFPDTSLQSVIAACDVYKQDRLSLTALAYFMGQAE